jgi:plasmid stabilization system protein ParE
LAEIQLNSIWDYGYQIFGVEQADKYLDGLFDSIDEIARTHYYNGLPPRLVPPDLINEISATPISFFRYEKQIVYLKDLSDGALGVVCILGNRMDTPNRLKESLLSPISKVE